MNSPSETYLARLERRLTKRWPQAEVDDSIQEIRIHLSDSASQLVQDGKSPAEAEVEALRRMGSDNLLAESLVRTRSGLDKRSIWRVGWLPALFIVALTTLPLALESTQGQGFEDIARLLAWLAFLFPVSFIYSSWRSRRILILPMATALTFGILSVSAWTFIEGPSGVTDVAAHKRAVIIQQMSAYLDQLGDQRKAAEIAMSGGSIPHHLDSASFDAPTKSIIVNETSMPYIPITISSDSEPDVLLSPVATASEARKLWKENGSAYVNKLRSSISEEKVNLDFWKHFEMSGSQVGSLVFRMLYESIWVAGALLLVNSIVLLLVWARRQLIQKTWRPQISS